MKIEGRDFEVSIPTPDGEAVADFMQIRIPMEWDKELAARHKTSLDLFWLKDKSLAGLDNLPEPGILADDILDNSEASLASFRALAASLSSKRSV
jgi:hypothetical protein